MSGILETTLLIVGGFFSLLAAVGLMRMPDLYTRMQTAAKAGTLGAGCIILAVAIHFGEAGITARALLVIGFIFLTTPAATQLIARSAYMTGVKLWKDSVEDELKGKYHPSTRALKGS